MADDSAIAQLFSQACYRRWRLFSFRPTRSDEDDDQLYIRCVVQTKPIQRQDFFQTYDPIVRARSAAVA